MKRTFRFLACEAGTMSVETVMVFPLLLWALIATFQFWDIFHSQSVSQRAAYTIADTLSRELDPVDDNYLQGLSDVQTYLIQGAHASRLRVTTITWDDVNNQFKVIWSHTPDTQWEALTDAALNDMADKIPQMAKGDVAIIVEAQIRYVPFINVGLDPMLMESFVVTRPRFGPQLVWKNADGTLVGFGSTV